MQTNRRGGACKLPAAAVLRLYRLQTLRDILDRLIESIRALLRGGDATIGAAEGRRLAEQAETAERCRDMVQEFLNELESARQNDTRRTEARRGGAQQTAAERTAASEDVRESRSVPAQDEDGQEQPYDIRRSFAQQAYDAIHGRMPQLNHDILVGTTPKVLQDIGMGKLPLTMEQHHASTIYCKDEFEAKKYNKSFVKENRDHFHDLKEKLYDLPNKIADPIAIITSETHPDTSIVVIVEETDGRGNEVMAAVEIGTTGKINGYDIDSNGLASYYAKKNNNVVTGLFQRALIAEDGGTPSVLYLKNNNNEAIRLAQTAGVQFPFGLRKSHGLIHTIHDVGINVNQFEKITDTQQFKRFFRSSKAVDENGEPLVLYTGANTVQGGSSDAVSGVRLTLDQQDDGNGQEAVYASIRNPLRVADEATLQRYLNRDGQYRQLMADGEEQQARDRAAAFLRSRSFDGVHLLDDGSGAEAWIALDERQVKSATDNIGTFDPRVADINYSRPVVGDDGRGGFCAYTVARSPEISVILPSGAASAV